MYKVFPIMLSAIVYVLGNNVREVGKTRAGRLYILEFLGLSNKMCCYECLNWGLKFMMEA